MQDPVIRICQCVDDTFPIVCKYFSPAEAERIRTEIKQTASNQTLQLMLYGAYNAGKSTLVNAMLGEERAVVNDIPTTDRVEEYSWSGFRLLDTPGVNAPIEHEETTEEQVKRTGLFLFVIRQGDHDVKNIYDRIFSLLKKDKKVFIILNHEASDIADKASALARINELLSIQAAEHGVSEETLSNVSIMAMNIKTALTGSLKKSEKLLDHSGYNDFVNEFKLWAGRYDDEIGHLERLRQKVDELWFAPFFSKMNKMEGVNTGAIVDSLQMQREKLESKKRILLHSASTKILQEVNLLRGDVAEILDTSASSDDCDSRLQKLFNPLPDKIGKWLESEIDDINCQLAIYLQSHHQHMQEERSNIPLGDITASALKRLDKDVIHQGLLLGRTLKIPGLKGRWESTLGKWAGKAAIAVQILQGLYEIYRAHSEQEKMNSQRIDRARSIAQATEQVCSSAAAEFIESVNNIINQSFNELISQIQNQIDEQIKEEGELAQNIEFMSKNAAVMKSISFSSL